MKLVYAADVPNGRDRVYARIITEADHRAGTLPKIKFGTLAKEYIELEPVKNSERTAGVIELDEIDRYYVTEIVEDFEERPIDGFVSELVERTPYPRKQAEVIVTHGWFGMSTGESIRVINQHLRDIYEERTLEEFEETLGEINQMQKQIENALEYPVNV